MIVIVIPLLYLLRVLSSAIPYRFMVFVIVSTEVSLSPAVWNCK
jgi:hypothetical protein